MVPDRFRSGSDPPDRRAGGFFEKKSQARKGEDHSPGTQQKDFPGFRKKMNGLENKRRPQFRSPFLHPDRLLLGDFIVISHEIIHGALVEFETFIDYKSNHVKYSTVTLM
jgi:hypothetical protein